jgi:CheY-like chemotaxis protein
VRQHQGVAPGSYVAITVTDTGTGMPSDVLARACEPFFTTKPHGKGTGLGLSTVSDIVKECGGHLILRSEVGHGTTVTSYFPRVHAPLETEVELMHSTRAANGNETILLVEDDKAIRELGHRILRASGYRVMTARDGNHALLVEATHAEAIHLLLTDVLMPDLSGPDLAQRLVRRRPAMKVLYISGFGHQMAVATKLVSRQTAFLQKPFTPEMLTVNVRELLDRQADVAGQTLVTR